MGKITIGAKLLKVLKGTSAGGKMGITAGAASFFGLEWLTNGGLAKSTGGLFGLDQVAGTIILAIICLVGGYLVIRKYGGKR